MKLDKTLSLHNFCAGYQDKEFVTNVTFSLENGSMAALLGPNGGGKTTLLRGICSLIDNNGTAFMNEKSLKHMRNRERSQYISYIPQNSGIPFSITALDAVLMGLNPQMRLLQHPSARQRENAMQIMKEIGINELATKDFIKLSGGQKQLVILARSLVQNTPLLLFDEPDSALDFNNKHFVLEKVRNVLYNQNRAAILSLHDANFALKYCDRVLLMKAGCLVGDFTPANASITEIEDNLKKIYQGIKIIDDCGCYIMVKEHS